MTSESRRGLSKAEFEQLLQRAAERQTLAERRDFTAAELVEAGRELGIDEETVRAVHAEHERALAQPPGRARPFDSALELRKEGDTLRLIMPAPAGRQGTAVLRILLAAGGVALIGAVGAGLPLVLVGAAIAVGVAYVSAWLGFSRAELRLRPDGSGRLIRTLGRRTWAIPLRTGQVRVRLGQRMTSNKYGGTYVEFLALDHGTDTFELLEGYSHPERAWALTEIERWLGHGGA